MEYIFGAKKPEGKFVRAFHVSLDDFISEAHQTFPENTLLSTASTQLAVIRTIKNEQDIAIEFYNFAKIYDSEILSKNVDFFFQVDSTGTDIYSLVFSQMKEILDEADTKTKSILFEHVYRLYKLAKIIALEK